MSEKFENDGKNKETVGQAMKKPSFWVNVLTTALGSFAGLMIIELANLNTLVENPVLRVVINILILMSTILIAEAICNAIRKAIKKK